jgi:antitoxin YefM
MYTYIGVVMQTLNFSHTRQSKESVVILSMQDYRSLEKTAYLMQSQANAKRLNRSIAQLLV